jgi:hypothetical protein
MRDARPDSPAPVSNSLSCFVPAAVPAAKAITMNASQPKIAIFRCWALHRPIRAAMFLEGFCGLIFSS